MTAQLPAFPRFVFTVFEPLSLLAGAVPAVLYPDWFISEQLTQAVPVAASENSRLIAQQLGNVYGLVFLTAVAVLYTTSELKVVRNYLVALLVADLGHIALTCYGLHRDGTLGLLAEWNAMTWGNVAVTAGLFLTRTAYLLGLFGPDAKPRVVKPDKGE